MQFTALPVRTLALVLLITLTIGASPVSGQERNPDRWEKDIAAIEKKIATGESPEGSVLFVGSSSIRLWKLEQSFPDLKASNHGFGGSVLSDSVHFFDRIVVPVKPSIIVLYAGDNDIAAGKSPDTVHADFRAFVNLVESQLPTCRKVVYIAIKPSIKRWESRDAIQKANSLIAGDCRENSRLEFLDIWNPMLGSDGRPNGELLVEDGLHLSDKGYTIWANALRPHLK